MLRDHWQAVIVDRLMRVAARSGEPLARRARDLVDLARIRAADCGGGGGGGSDGGAASSATPAGPGDPATGLSAAQRIGREGALEPPPAGKPPVDTPVISVALLQRGVAAVLRGEGQVPDCEKLGSAVRALAV